MTISIEAEQARVEVKASNRLTLRLIDQEGSIIFDRIIPEDKTERGELFLLALFRADTYYAVKRINGSGAI